MDLFIKFFSLVRSYVLCYLETFVQFLLPSLMEEFCGIMLVFSSMVNLGGTPGDAEAQRDLLVLTNDLFGSMLPIREGG